MNFTQNFREEWDLKMLNFLGMGSAFNTDLGNTSAFIRENENFILIDCGGMVFHQLMERKLLEGVKQLHILITHTHPDHIGSLGDIIFYAYYKEKVIPKVYFKDMDRMMDLLNIMGVEAKMVDIIIDEKVNILMDKYEVRISTILTSHVDLFSSYGYLIELNGQRFYYSGDANDIPKEILELLKLGQLDLLYQDTCGLDYDGNVHLSLNKLCEMIPKDLRNRVVCMHLDRFLDLDAVLDYGFQLQSLYKGV
jgi:phosphoribosyl 1,2-cyclic phosphodiesterase